MNELLKKLKELKETRAALMAEVEKPETGAERFAEIRSEVAKLDFSITDVNRQIAEEEKAEETRAARDPSPAPANGVIFDTAQKANPANEAAEKRGADLKAGKSVKYETRATQVSGGTIPLAQKVSGEIVPTFEQVGTIDTLVKTDSIPHAEAYSVPFVKSYGEGGETAEGEDYTDADPTFGYAKIGRKKITAYAEISEECEKLPAADYDAVVHTAVIAAVRRKVINNIFNGTDGFVGLLNAPTDIIEEKCAVSLSEIDENTLDEFIYDYGGDENVEGDAVIIMNKLTLKEFAKVKGTDKRRAYDIVLRGNSGTINTIPFVLTSKLPAFSAADADDTFMLYGKLKGYQLTYFSDMDVQRSTDYKFKQGMIAYKASVIAGGSPAMYNGFWKITKAE